MKPWMTDPEIDAIGAIIGERRPRHVLEWGSGGSTATFAPLLGSRSDRIPDRIRYWTAIEHDPKWLEMTRRESPAWVEFLPAPSGPRSDPAAWRDYIDPPAIAGRWFDLILIDGRMRRRCLIVARQKLNRDGVVLLHDAERTHYHPGMAGYRGEFLLPRLWIGRLENK